MTSFADTSLLMGNQKVAPITGWEKSASHMKAWAVFCTVFLGNKAKHPATFEMFLLINETSGVSLRLRRQARQQSAFPTTLLRLIHQEFDESFHQEMERRQRVWWTYIEGLRQALATGNFRPKLVALPGGLAPPERFVPLPAASRGAAETAPPQANGNPPPAQ